MTIFSVLRTKPLTSLRRRHGAVAYSAVAPVMHRRTGDARLDLAHATRAAGMR